MTVSVLQHICRLLYWLPWTCASCW